MIIGSSTRFQAVGGISLEFIENRIQAGAVTVGTNSFPAVDFGTPQAGRIIVVSVGWRQAVISAVTIGGVAASRAVSSNSTGSPEFGSEIWLAVVPSGTSGDVVVSVSSVEAVSVSWISLGLYRVFGASSVLHSTDNANNSTTYTPSFSVPSGGGVISTVASNANAPDCSWSTLAEDFDVDPNDGISDDIHSGGSVMVSGSTSLSASLSSSLAQYTAWCSIILKP